MRNKPYTVSAVFALFTVVCFYGYLRSLSAEPRAASRLAREPLVAVVVARMDLARSEVIRPDRLDLRRVPESQAPEKALTSLGAAIGQMCAFPMKAGQTLTQDSVQRRDDFGLPGALDANMMGVCLSLEDPILRSGLLKPGDRVDVLAALRSGRVLTAVRNAQVLAVGGALAGGDPRGQQGSTFGSKPPSPPGGADSVTLALPPGGAELMSGLAGAATLRLAVRPLSAGPRQPTEVNPAAASAVSAQQHQASDVAAAVRTSLREMPRRNPEAQRLPAVSVVPPLPLPRRQAPPVAKQLPRASDPARAAYGDPDSVEVIQGTSRTVVPLN
jgi:Flp pilus assembly protein CpaB